ncbi:glycosyl hydrolase family 18 protein, partial [Streptomyces sp. NPDC006386]
MPTPHRSRFRTIVSAACCAVLGAGLLAGAGTSATAATPAQEAAAASTAASGPKAPGPKAAGSKVIGYFTEWGTYDRKYHVRNIETSGSAARLTHINYAFGNVTGGRCAMGDAYAATDRAYTAAESVDGKADTWDQPLRGNFNQLRKLKQKHPNLKVLWSFGGWTWSAGFGEAAKNPAAFARSCYDLVEDSRWADVFDGIDIDWEYPNAC